MTNLSMSRSDLNQLKPDLISLVAEVAGRSKAKATRQLGAISKPKENTPDLADIPY